MTILPNAFAGSFTIGRKKVEGKMYDDDGY
jgi:hypothetical protein